MATTIEYLPDHLQEVNTNTLAERVGAAQAADRERNLERASRPIEAAVPQPAENAMLLGPTSAAGLNARVTRLERMVLGLTKRLAEIGADQERLRNPRPDLASK